MSDVDWDAVIASENATTVPLFDAPVVTKAVGRRAFPMPRDTHDLVPWAQQAGYEAGSYRESRLLTTGHSTHRAVLKRDGATVWRCDDDHDDRDSALVCAHAELRERFLSGAE